MRPPPPRPSYSITFDTQNVEMGEIYGSRAVVLFLLPAPLFLTAFSLHRSERTLFIEGIFPGHVPAGGWDQEVVEISRVRRFSQSHRSSRVGSDSFKSHGSGRLRIGPDPTRPARSYLTREIIGC